MKKQLWVRVTIIIFLMAGCAGKDNKETMRVMTMNIRYNNPSDSINSWPDRLGLMTAFINREQPDIIGMQEVTWKQYTDLDSLLPEYLSAGAGRDDGEKGGEMNPVFFRKDRFDMTRTITFWLSENPGEPGSMAWGASLPRIVTWMELVRKDSHEHFFCFNTHFAHDSDSARKMSAQILLDTIPDIAEGFPFIISGDFNMLPDSKGYEILTGPDKSVSLLEDSYFISEKKPTGPSYTFNGFSDEPGPGRIDYIFVRNGMKVLGHKTYVEKKGNVFISDHWPVEAVVSL